MIKAKTPNTNLKPNFPFSSITSELSIITSAIPDFISSKVPRKSPSVSLPLFKLSRIGVKLLSNISVKPSFASFKLSSAVLDTNLYSCFHWSKIESVVKL